MLSSVIDTIIMPRVRSLKDDLENDGGRSLAGGAIKMSSITIQTLYTFLMQMKAYYTLVGDVTAMYIRIDHDNLRPGMDMLSQMSQMLGDGDPSAERMAGQVVDYTARAVSDVRGRIEAVSHPLVMYVLIAVC